MKYFIYNFTLMMRVKHFYSHHDTVSCHVCYPQDHHLNQVHCNSLLFKSIIFGICASVS